MIIQLKNIFKSYFSAGESIEQKVLQGLNLEIKPENSIAITGPSGSGKTTLLNILGSLDRADSGELLFDEKDLTQLSKNDLSLFRNQEIGFVFQSHHLLPQLTAFENILLPTLAFGNKETKATAKDRAIQWMEKFDLKAETHKYPSQLSGGESQRVAVIRALINQPNLILADEPTGSLDAKAAENLGEIMQHIHQSEHINLVVVTHSQAMASKMDLQYHLEEGQLH
jgi:ABC-type lipoprotein export system ATPase subunit